MKTTNAGKFDSNAAGRAIAIALLAGLKPEAKARLAARVRARQQTRNLPSTEGTQS